MDSSKGTVIILRSCIVALFVIAFTGCGVTQPVRPVPEGTTQVIASFGGPIIPFAGIAIPVPYLNAGVLYGAGQNMTLYGNAHLTALLFKNIGVDGGFASRLLPEKGLRPEITLNGRGYFFWDVIRGTTKHFYPMGTLIGSYSIGERSLFYFGADNLYQFSTSDLFISPFAGYSFPVGEYTVMQVETKWAAMNHETQHGIFEGAAAVGGKGNIGIYFGLQYDWK
jgi:hypothetical protein